MIRRLALAVVPIALALGFFNISGAAASSATLPSTSALSSYMHPDVPPGLTVVSQSGLDVAAIAKYTATPKAGAAALVSLSGRTFTAYYRTWLGQGVFNGITELVVALDSDRDAAAFLSAQKRALVGIPFARVAPIAGIPGSLGYVFLTTTPADAVEQVSVFQTGRYVATSTLLSVADPTNTAPFTPEQSAVVASNEYRLLYSAPGGTGTIVRQSHTKMIVGALALVGLGLALLAVIVLYRRRGSDGLVTGTRPIGLDENYVPLPPSPVGHASGEFVDTYQAANTGGGVGVVQLLRRPPAGTPAGWLPDPEVDSGRIRYWDGTEWSDFVADPVAQPDVDHH